MLTLGNRLINMRKERGFTAKEVMERAKVSDLGRFEKDEKRPSVDTLLALADFYGTTTDWLLRGEPITHKIKVFSLPASAGRGSELLWLGPQYEMVPFEKDDLPQAITCGVRIAGDSMEPLISDGDIVFVREYALATNGDIGIFTYYDMAYCKRLNIGKDNKITLISENPKYKPIIIEEPDLLNCLGKVIMP